VGISLSSGVDPRRRLVRPLRAVLIVSPDLALQDAYVKLLRDGRQFVMTAGTHDDALMLAGELKLDAIVFDVTTEDDWQSCRLLQQRSCSPDAPIIVLIRSDPSGSLSRQAKGIDCAAVILGACPPRVLVDLVRRVGRGEREIELSS
jgi:CheY-like chemotaxis protein